MTVSVGAAAIPPAQKGESLSKAALLRAYEQSHDAILITDRDNIIVAANGAFCQLSGYSHDELVGKDPRILASGNSTAELYANMWDSLATRDFWEGEIWNKRKDGTTYPRWLKIAVLRNADGSVQSHVANFTDISASKEVAERLAYLAELASVQLTGLDHLILVDVKAPVAFFAYPGKKSYLVPEGCQLLELASFKQDVLGSLDKLARAVGAEKTAPVLQALKRPGLPRGKFTADKVCKALGQLIPENAIIVDEAITSGLMLAMYTAGAPRHDVITLTGGAIGQGLPCAVGAAIACPDRKVIALEGDGSAMYTLQALWTMAREKLDVINIIFSNRAYAVLNIELQRVGAGHVGDKAKAQLDLSTPPLDFVQLGQGMGVSSRRATTTAEFVAALEHALRTPGPHLIEAVVPPTLAGLKLRVLPHLLQSLANLPQPIARALKRKIAP